MEMDFKSYMILQNLSSALIATGDFDSDDESIWSDWTVTKYPDAVRLKQELTDQLIIDAGTFFNLNITSTTERFVLFDEWDHGSTHIDYCFRFAIKDHVFDLRFKCMLFLDRIIVSFDDTTIFQRCKNELLLKKLRKFNKTKDNHFFIEFETLLKY